MIVAVGAVIFLLLLGGCASTVVKGEGDSVSARGRGQFTAERMRAVLSDPGLIPAGCRLLKEDPMPSKTVGSRGGRLVAVPIEQKDPVVDLFVFQRGWLYECADGTQKHVQKEFRTKSVGFSSILDGDLRTMERRMSNGPTVGWAPRDEPTGISYVMIYETTTVSYTLFDPALGVWISMWGDAYSDIYQQAPRALFLSRALGGSSFAKDLPWKVAVQGDPFTERAIGRVFKTDPARPERTFFLRAIPPDLWKVKQAQLTAEKDAFDVGLKAVGIPKQLRAWSLSCEKFPFAHFSDANKAWETLSRCHRELKQNPQRLYEAAEQVWRGQ